jgi:hypothetical protein
MKIWRGKKPTIKYFRTFGSTCYILCDRENLGKFDPKSDEGIFFGYSSTSHAYRVFNKRTKTVMESINVFIDDEEVDRASSGKKISLLQWKLLMKQLIMRRHLQVCLRMSLLPLSWFQIQRPVLLKMKMLLQILPYKAFARPDQGR